MIKIKNERNSYNYDKESRIIVIEDITFNKEMLMNQIRGVGLDQYTFQSKSEDALDHITSIVNDFLCTAKIFPVFPIAIVVLNQELHTKNTGLDLMQEIN
jgi:hypothetical protein